MNNLERARKLAIVAFAKVRVNELSSAYTKPSVDIVAEVFAAEFDAVAKEAAEAQSQRDRKVYEQAHAELRKRQAKPRLSHEQLLGFVQGLCSHGDENAAALANFLVQPPACAFTPEIVDLLDKRQAGIDAQPKEASTGSAPQAEELLLNSLREGEKKWTDKSLIAAQPAAAPAEPEKCVHCDHRFHRGECGRADGFHPSGCKCQGAPPKSIDPCPQIEDFEDAAQRDHELILRGLSEKQVQEACESLGLELLYARTIPKLTAALNAALAQQVERGQ